MPWLMYNDTVFGRLLDSCDDNGSLVAVSVMELDELLEWVIANDIGIENEERRVVFSKNLLGEFERSGSP